MQTRLWYRAVLFFAVAAPALGFASIARAQLTPGPSGMMDPGSMLKQGAAMAPKPAEGPLARPPALPGAASRANTAAPATTIPTDMSPNDALFDAINRGDIGAARDALSRGAELSAHNVLGMTPMDLSVDLGRNDISFLLMSYRNTDTTTGTTASAKAATAAPDARTASAKAASAKTAAAAKPAPRSNVVPVKDVVPAAPQAPRLFANDGGAPVPGAGFLGFDAGRSAH